MATNPPLDLVLAPIRGDSHEAHTVQEWLVMFHLALVAVDPRNERSRWIVGTAGRILRQYEQADCRVAWLVAGDADDARRLLGPWAEEVMTFADPDLKAIKGLGLARLPAIVHLAMDGSVAGAVEGWDPPAWRRLTHELSRVVSWSRPLVPAPGDPAPFEGAPIPA